MDAAASAAYQPPAPVTTQQPTVEVGGVSLPGGQSTVQGPAQFDRAAFLSKLAQSNPLQAQGMQSQFASQDLAAQKDHLALAEQFQKLDAGKRSAALQQLNGMGQIYGAVLQADPAIRPQLFSELVQRGIQAGALNQDTPSQYQGDQRAQASMQAVTSLTEQFKQSHDNATAAETARHNKAMEGKQTPGVDVPLSPAVEQQKIRITAAGKAAGADAGAPEVTTVDPASGSILAQTGLSMNAFRALVGDTKSLSRDKATRNAANKEAQQFANKAGIDVSTLPSRYAAINKVLQNNIERQNNTQVMENELEGTIQNLSQVANDKDLGKLKIANVFKIWAGQEVNDDLAQQYALHLNQLRNELAAYNAATQGRTGGSITVQDVQEAERTIKNGISAGSLKGLETAVQNSTKKMGSVMQNSVDAANKSVWDLFGVGKNFKSKNNNEPKPDPLGIR